MLDYAKRYRLVKGIDDEKVKVLLNDLFKCSLTPSNRECDKIITDHFNSKEVKTDAQKQSFYEKITQFKAYMNAKRDEIKRRNPA